MTRIIKVCKTCRSEDVWLDANAEWDSENQCWELKSTFDNAWCDGECEGETTIVDEEVPETETIVAQPIPALVEQDRREAATILGSLRALQNIQQHEAPAPEIMAILTDGGTLKPMDDGEVDALCEKLNLS